MSAEAPITSEPDLYQSNLRLNRTEFALNRIHLMSMPRYLSVVIGTRCNIDCPYCYQAKTGDSLLAREPFGDQLRRELAAFYPYLSTLRIGGGEVFLIPGFEELVEEVSASVNRPIVSVSTNGTLIDDTWAQRIVDLPFQGITVSIDGAKPETYARLRRGASLERVLANVRRLQALKSRRNAQLPELDFFFLVMRSNYREIPMFLQLATDHGIERVSFQMLLVDHRNLGREPGLGAEVAFEPDEVRELHDLARGALGQQRSSFRSINVSGFHSLFESHGLETGFLDEGRFSIYPDNAGKVSTHDARQPPGNEIELCPNPWTLMYVTETGDVHVCFMATPVGNLYETPLIRLWNAPRAVAARADIINGRYEAAACSKLWCSWREGKKSRPPAAAEIRALMDEFKGLTEAALKNPLPATESIEPDRMLVSVRRMLTERNQRIAELESNFVGLCEKNREMLEMADKQNQHLAGRVAALERVATQFTSGGKVALATDVRFGKGLPAKILKKTAIGMAVRSIRILDWAGNRLRQLVNRLCR